MDYTTTAYARAYNLALHTFALAGADLTENANMALSRIKYFLPMAPIDRCEEQVAQTMSALAAFKGEPIDTVPTESNDLKAIADLVTGLLHVVEDCEGEVTDVLANAVLVWALQTSPSHFCKAAMKSSR